MHSINKQIDSRETTSQEWTPPPVVVLKTQAQQKVLDYMAPKLSQATMVLKSVVHNLALNLSKYVIMCKLIFLTSAQRWK